MLGSLVDFDILKGDLVELVGGDVQRAADGVFNTLQRDSPSNGRRFPAQHVQSWDDVMRCYGYRPYGAKLNGLFAL